MAITPKSEDKYVEKCSTAQSFIRTEMSTYKIGTLMDYEPLDYIICYRDVGRCENAPLCSGYNVTAGTYSQYLGPKFQTLQHQTILRNCRRCVLWGFLLPKKKKLMIFLESLLPGGMKWRSLTLRTFILGGKLVMCWMTCTNWNHLRLTRRFFEKLKYPPNNLNMTFE